MEKQKKTVKMSLKTLIFILIIFTVAIAISIYCLNIYVNNKPQETEQLSNENVPQETTSDDGIVEQESKYGKMILDYLNHIWVMPEVYKECMGEFDDIKNAPKDYLVSCAGMNVMQECETDIYAAKTKFDEFNDKLVELFGPEVGNNIVTEENLKDLFFVHKNEDGTYSFSGFCGSEVSSTIYKIKEIKKQGNLFNVELYEYKSESEEVYIELNPGEQTYEKIYDRRDNLITTITVKAEKDYSENVTSFVSYDENGNKIENYEKFLIENYKDKLSIRSIKLEYNQANDKFIMLSNKLSGVAKANNSSENDSVANSESVEEKKFDEGIYIYNNSEELETISTNEELPIFNFESIVEFKNGKFEIFAGNFVLYGNYEKKDNNILKCYITESDLDYGGEENIIDLRNKNLYIEFEIIGNNKLKVNDCNYSEETELSITLNNVFANDNKYMIFDSNSIIGEWNSKFVYDNKDGEYIKEELRYIFGSVVSQAGSSITFNENGTFEDYVDPVNEGDVYRKGSYTVSGNSINLIYDDDNTSNNVEIYILNENNILYVKEQYKVILTK